MSSEHPAGTTGTGWIPARHHSRQGVRFARPPGGKTLAWVGVTDVGIERFVYEMESMLEAVSVIIPAFNEEGEIGEVVDRIGKTLSSRGCAS